MPRIVRLRYAHSDPLFYYSKLNVIWSSNNESIRHILEGKADVGFVPLTYAVHYCDLLYIIPRFAIYSDGPVISARLFEGKGMGYAAVSDTTVNAMALMKLMNIKFDVVDDIWGAFDRYRGVLVIGDDALRLVDRGHPYIVDVGELWAKKVGEPLVYAVMVARRSIDKHLLDVVINDIEGSLSMFEGNPEPVIKYTSARIGVSEDLIREYFMSIRHRVNDRVVKAIETELRIFELPNCIQFLGT